MKFPQMGQKLFDSGGRPTEYAHVAWGYIDTRFYMYIAGYKEAADTLIQRALKDGSNEVLDTYVFPACFLYRHYLELSLKDIYLNNSRDSKTDKRRTIQTCQHSLRKIWAKVKPLIRADFPDDDKAVLEAAEGYIHQFADADRHSFAFRYPVTKQLDPVHKKEKFINLANLAKRMSELESFLASVSAGMSARRTSEEEMLFYYTMDTESFY